MPPEGRTPEGGIMETEGSIMWLWADNSTRGRNNVVYGLHIFPVLEGGVA